MSTAIEIAITLLVVINGLSCEEKIMDIPADSYLAIVSNNCMSIANYSSCALSRQRLYNSVKIHTIEDRKELDERKGQRECCLYRLYLDCFEDSLYSAGCRKSVFEGLKVYIYDYYYNFETKCPDYEKGSEYVSDKCKPRWPVWLGVTLMLVMLFVVIVVMAVAVIFCWKPLECLED